MLIKVTEKCKVSYIDENKKEVEEKKVNYSFRNFYYDSDKENFNDAVVDFILNFDPDRGIDENAECEYDGEYLESMGYIGFAICEE